MAWFWLILGGVFEVGFTTSLRFVDGFKNLPWTLAFLLSVAISMALLELASRTIPMGTAYAVWGGIGAVGTVVVGILWFQEPSSTIRVLLILAIVAAIAAPARVSGSTVSPNTRKPRIAAQTNDVYSTGARCCASARA